MGHILKLIKANCSPTTKGLIHQLNNRLRGRAYYHRHVVSKKSFAYVDHKIFLSLITWISRRHPEKSAQWKRERYFCLDSLRQCVFFAAIRDVRGSATNLDLFSVASVPITLHIKIQTHATQYDPAFTEYFIRRAEARRGSKLSWLDSTAEA